MLNMIKMDIYRLFKTKSVYVIWLIWAFLLFGTTYMTSMDIKAAVSQEEHPQAVEQSEDAEPVELGISVQPPTKIGEKVTVYDMVWSNIQGKVIALFIVIFAVLFSTADSNSGYIKNIGGQVRKRWGLIVSKAVAIFVFILCTMGLSVVLQAVSNGVILGYLRWGNLQDFGSYFVIQFFLHFALALICMTVAILIRNNVVTMIFAVCLCMNVLTLFYSAIDRIVHKMGYQDFCLLEHLVTGKISLLPMTITQKAGCGAIAVSVAFIIGMLVFSSIVFEKRDIV